MEIKLEAATKKLMNVDATSFCLISVSSGPKVDSQMTVLSLFL